MVSTTRAAPLRSSSADHPALIPEVDMSLRPQEHQILVGIEDQLSRNDPALADLFARHPPPSVGRDYFRPSALLSLLVVLVVLVLAYPLAALGGPAAVGLLTAVLIVPWMAACVGALARGRTPQPSRSSSAHRDVGVTSVHLAGHHRTAVLALTRPSDAPTGLAIGLIVGAVVAATVVGSVEIALLVVAVVLLGAAHILRWRARRALFRRIRDHDTDA
jgi:hypothetical protein